MSATGHRKQKEFLPKNTCVQICKMIIIIDTYFRYFLDIMLDIFSWVTNSSLSVLLFQSRNSIALCFSILVLKDIICTLNFANWEQKEKKDSV